MELIGQIVGIIAMFMNIIAVQFKKPRQLFICRLIGGCLWSLNFLLLGSPTGAIMNLIDVVRSIFLLRKETSTKTFLWITLAMFTVAGLLTMDYSLSLLMVIDILIIISQLVDTAGMWTNNIKVIRRCQLFAISPVWLIHNIAVFSIGGILTESFTIVSTLIAMYRYRNYKEA
jgi:hypothetical protein